MDPPSPETEPIAFLPGWRVGTGDDHAWPPGDRAAVIADARRERVAEGGLPVDDATLERVADNVRDPAYRLPGLYLTQEEATDGIPDGLIAAVEAYFRTRPACFGHLALGWHEGRRVVRVGVVGALDIHRARLDEIGGDRVVLVPFPVTQAELVRVEADLAAEIPQLEAEGIVVMGFGGAEGGRSIEIEVVAPSANHVRERLERYGDRVTVEWLGASLTREVAHPFGSWAPLEGGALLRVWFGLDRNGEAFVSATAAEAADRIVVTVTRSEPVGARTLVGGFSAHHADIPLAAPVDQRTVIDGSCGERRPSLAELRGRTG